MPQTIAHATMIAMIMLGVAGQEDSFDFPCRQYGQMTLPNKVHPGPGARQWWQEPAELWTTPSACKPRAQAGESITKVLLDSNCVEPHKNVPCSELAGWMCMSRCLPPFRPNSEPIAPCAPQFAAPTTSAAARPHDDSLPPSGGAVCSSGNRLTRPPGWLFWCYASLISLPISWLGILTTSSCLIGATSLPEFTFVARPNLPFSTPIASEGLSPRPRSATA